MRGTVGGVALWFSCFVSVTWACPEPPYAVPADLDQQQVGVPTEPDPSPEISDWGALEAAILSEMNLMRRAPRSYAQKLRALRRAYRGNTVDRGPDRPALLTEEGVSAVDEAINALEEAPARLPRLSYARGLAQAAAAHAADLGAHDLLGHDGSDGSQPDTRVGRFGVWDGTVAENISFGPSRAEEVVAALLIDDGVPDRGHREILLTADLFYAGVGCADHPTYATSCVIEYATRYRTHR